MLHDSGPVWRFSDIIIFTRFLISRRTFHLLRASVHPNSAAGLGDRNMIWIANCLAVLVAALYLIFWR
jgi:hypothetical protein